jgi:hypothetical protein
LLFKLFVFL